MSPARSRHVARLVAMRKHAEADTAEGCSAARLAAQYAEQHRVTEDEVETWTAERNRLASTKVELDGWGVPWLFALANTCALLEDCAIELGAGPTVTMRGMRAGQAVRRAEIVKRRVDAMVARLGPALNDLPLVVQVPGVYAPTSTAATTSGSYFFAQTMRSQQVSLARLCVGDDLAEQTYRLVLVTRMLGDEARAALARHEEMRRAQARQQPSPVRPPWTAPPPQQEAPPPPPQSEQPAEEPPPEVLRLLRNVEWANGLLGRVMQAGPAWAQSLPVEPVEANALECAS